MTEDEAKLMWCPYARVCATETDHTAAPAHVGYNRVYVEGEGEANFDNPSASNPEIARCIASACMAWRKTGSKCKNRQGQISDRDVDGTGQWIEVGYCGLAGGPS